MQQFFEVVIDHGRRDSCVAVPASFIDAHLRPLYGRDVPHVVPLRLTAQGSDGPREMFAGCLGNRPHRDGNAKVSLSATFAQDLGLSAGEMIECAVLPHCQRATKVLVSPLTVDDSEVVEQNAMRIEQQLLQQLVVVYQDMRFTVHVFSGVQAKVRVQSIECGEGREMQRGCAAMFEGTQFIVATRARAIDPATSVAEPPQWAVLRAMAEPNAAETETPEVPPSASDKAALTLVMSDATAQQHKWGDGITLGVLDLAQLATLDEPHLTPSFLRANVVLMTVRVREGVPPHHCTVSGIPQATNILCIPNTEDGYGSGEKLPSWLSAAPLADHNHRHPTLAQLAEVHGDLPQQLLRQLEFATGDSTGTGSGNVLLSGGKGYGKSCILSTVLRQLPTIHTVHVECSLHKGLLARLQSAVQECVLAAPSVLVLENFDAIAPEQKEGSHDAMSLATRATLESSLTQFTNTCAPSHRCRMVVVATCSSRESVNEYFRSALCFQSFMAVEALSRATRCALLQQLFATESAEAVSASAALMDNYTPFDMVQVAQRIRHEDADTPLVDRSKACVANFTPLAHSGIKFLKGERVQWTEIGGLTEAKKALHDTLVLPMQHPALFARLPLKTRSGILLYGPSGCGKTYILEALVNAEDLNCIVVNGPEVFGKYIGQSEQKIRDVFERAQAAAPCVIFFDEFDSVAPQRGVDNSGVTDRVVNQLLCYLDGVEGRKDVYVVAASSRPDLIDAALLRPGRLDKAVVCPIPDAEDRRTILQFLCKKASAELTEDQIRHVVEQTNNWTPADLSAMVSTASSFVSQRIVEAASAESAAADNNSPDAAVDSPFVIASVGTGISQDKVKDSLQSLVRQSGLTRSAAAAVSLSPDFRDFERAIADTRPSLSQRDIAKFQRIHALFKRGESLPVEGPGTKITFG